MAQKYLFIAISFYHFIAILCAKMSRVNKALAKLFDVHLINKREHPCLFACHVNNSSCDAKEIHFHFFVMTEN
jgi:hypothetical protein